MSAKVIVFASFKGGVGKTTSTVAAAAEIGRRGSRVKLLDMDITANAFVNLSLAADREEGMPVVGEHLAALVRSNPRGISAAIKKAAEEFDFVLIDTPGSIESDGTQASLIMADLIVVPLRPAAYDLHSTQQTVELLDRVKILNPTVEIRLLRVAPKRTTLNATIERILVNTELPVMDAVLHELVAFVEMSMSGHSLWSMGRSAEKADREVKALVDEMFDVLRGTSELEAERVAPSTGGSGGHRGKTAPRAQGQEVEA